MGLHWFVGVDWAQTAHAVCLLDARGRVRAQWTTPHTAAGLAELGTRLRRRGAAATIGIAIERPTGVLVDTLVEAGFAVVAIHPNVLKASRARYRAAGAKSDAADAYMLADLLRTDGHRFRRVQPLSDATRALRALVRTRDDVVAMRVGAANQLRALLESFWPGAVTLFAEIDSAIALAFLRRYPTPQQAARLGATRLQAFLASRRYSGRRSAAELLARLHAAPASPAGEEEVAAKGEAVAALVEVLTTLGAQLQTLTAAIRHALATHADGPVVMSLPRAGRVNAAQLLAEIGDDRARWVSEEHLAAEAGVVPVTYASGRQRGVGFRWACNKRLRRALTCFADNSRHGSPWAADVYARALARGCDHPHAIRILARAWLRVLWPCWQTRTPYDVTAHRGAVRVATAA
jgi:transposase